MKELQEKIWSLISKESVIQLTEDLIAIPSYKGIKNQETGVANYIKALFDAHEIDSKCIEVEHGRCNVIARIKGTTPGKTLMLNGHLDTVPIYDMENALRPNRVDGKLYGRGAVDMKGPVACMISTLIVLKKMDLPFKGEIIFAGVIDEEEKSLGTIHLIENSKPADAVIIGEPTGLNVCIAHRGLQWIEVMIRGKTVHGGSQEQGLNAISLAGVFISYIEKRMAKYVEQSTHPIIGRGSFNIGTIQGGTQPSTVAGECSIKFDRRWLPGENYEKIMEQIGSIVREFCVMHPSYGITYKIVDESIMSEGYHHESMDTSTNELIVESALMSMEEILETPPQPTYFKAWSDGALFQHYKNIPTIVFGPGDLTFAHSSQEHIELESLYKGVQVYTSCALNYLNS